MNKVVLDAPALLALLQEEPGAEEITAGLLARSSISTVNLAEVQTKLAREGGEAGEAWRAVLTPNFEIHPFTTEHAKIAGSLAARTRDLGLSLGTELA